MYKIKIAQFEGPLDLLLQLIEEQKLNITQISLATVTEQYIKILYQIAELGKIIPDELADFLVIAAKLLLIKSRALLPYLVTAEEAEGGQLEQQLKIYRQYYLASKQIAKILAQKNIAFSREKLLVNEPIGFQSPKNLTRQKLAQVFEEILKKLEPFNFVPTSVVRRTINISEKINQLKQLILERINLNFGELLRNAKNRTEVVISFLAILELMKQRIIIVKQDNIFEEIRIEKIK